METEIFTLLFETKKMFNYLNVHNMKIVVLGYIRMAARISHSNSCAKRLSIQVPERWLSRKDLTNLTEDLAWPPRAHTRWLTTICSSSCPRSDPLFWSSLPPAYTQCT